MVMLDTDEPAAPTAIVGAALISMTMLVNLTVLKPVTSVEGQLLEVGPLVSFPVTLGVGAVSDVRLIMPVGGVDNRACPAGIPAKPVNQDEPSVAVKLTAG